MWGPKAAAPQLNFSLGNYPQEERQQRFGPALSSFLTKIVEESVAVRALKKVLRMKTHMPANWQARDKRNLEIGKIRSTKIIDERKKCGLCPACRQPWLAETCYRKKAAARIGYKATTVAERMLDEAIDGEISGPEISELSSSSANDESAKEDQDDGDIPEAPEKGVKRGTGKSVTGKKESLSEFDLEWYGEPPKGPNTVPRGQHNKKIESSHLQAESAAADEAARDFAAFEQLLDENQPLIWAVAQPPKDFVPLPPQRELLRHAVECTTLGADVALVGEDDPRWNVTQGQTGRGQCSMCFQFHGNVVRNCPLIQAAYAVPKNYFKEACPRCVSAKVPGCKNCGRGALPEGVWAPASAATPWLNKIAPATQDVMHSVQSMASAAAIDFDRPDVAGKLGPSALLAIGLLAEEVAAAQIKAGMIDPQ